MANKSDLLDMSGVQDVSRLSLEDLQRLIALKQLQQLTQNEQRQQEQKELDLKSAKINAAEARKKMEHDERRQSQCGHMNELGRPATGAFRQENGDLIVVCARCGINATGTHQEMRDKFKGSFPPAAKIGGVDLSTGS